MDKADIKELVKLLVENKLDRLKIGDIEICKSRHDQPKVEIKSNNPISNQVVTDPDELLYWSTSSPVITKEDLEELSENGSGFVKPKQHNKKNKVS